MLPPPAPLNTSHLWDTATFSSQDGLMRSQPAAWHRHPTCRVDSEPINRVQSLFQVYEIGPNQTMTAVAVIESLSAVG